MQFSSNSFNIQDMHSRDDNAARKIISIQYALYFGTVGVFLPYFNLYCYHLGFNGVQIGVLSSLRSVVLVVVSLAWGVVADRFHIRKPLYILCILISTLIWSFYFFTNTFWGMFTNQHSIRGQVILRSMGIEAIPVTNVENACAGASTALHLAYTSVKAGMVDVALALGLSLIHISEPTRPRRQSRMPSSA